MTVHELTPQRHPVLACADAVAVELDRVADVDPVFMSTADKAAALVELTRLTARLQALTLRVLANAEDVALDDGSRSAEAWLAHV